jgi:DNA gyrase subunit B
MVALKKLKKDTYDEHSIQALEGLEAVRLRPAMYVADTGSAGAFQLTRELIDNSVDEYQAGYNKYLKVEAWTKGEKRNQVRVTDKGRGVPVKKHPKLGIATLTAVFSRLHTGGKFGGDGGYKTSAGVSGLHGVGVKATNALSEFLKVTVQREGGKFTQEFRQGKPVAEVKRVGDATGTGTSVLFKHDSTIFRGVDVDPDAIQERLEEVAYLCPGLRVIYVVDGHERNITKDGGLRQYLKDQLDVKKVKPLHKVISYTDSVDLGEKGGKIEVEVAFAWTQDSGDHWFSFVNVCSVLEGGTQVTGMKSAIAKVFSGLVKDAKIPPDYFRDGLYVASHIRLQNPMFKSQAKVRLLNAEVRDPANKVMTKALTKALKKFEDLGQSVIDRAKMLKAAREKLAKAMEAVRRIDLKVRKRGVLPDKLAEAPAADPKEREIFLVEGDSAGGSAKHARDGKFQEVLSLKGKVVNAARSEPHVVFKNAEYLSVVSVIGCGVDNIGTGDEEGCDPYKRGRIQAGGTAKLCLLMDADPDGQHITALMITFLIKYMRPLVDAGMVYVVDSPLYVGKWRDRREHGHTKKEVRKKFPKGAKPEITYLKGHGEASAEQIEDYAFGPKRRLWKLTLEDDSEIEGVIAVMGSDGTERKKLLGIEM